ncbi:Lrp/AsnC family transcriptional regulator [Streptomyces sp. NPDC096198]|uniref:Lrp/AsnC family transcriptional regulator n=1 Tax=Streptomyces sp. NPDC096198 TaxID=3366080 RepID=UPI00382710A7
MGKLDQDDLDRKIIHALQIDGRASFRRIAEVLDVSPQTVNRRYAQLRTSAALKVVGLTHPGAVGQERWLLRVRCAPSAMGAVAQALARHEEAMWVHVTSGGTEIVCVAHNNEDAEPLLLGRLPRTPQVLAITAHCILHSYYGGPDGFVNKISPLSEEQVEALGPLPAEGVDPIALTDLDRALLKVLRSDGRATFQDLARAGGCAQSTAQRRVAELYQQGVLYFDVDHSEDVFSRARNAMLWLSVAPNRLDSVGRALAAHSEISFAASTTGTTNLFAVVSCTSTRALHQYLTGPLAALPGVSAAETAPVIRMLKRSGQLVGQPGTGRRTSG